MNKIFVTAIFAGVFAQTSVFSIVIETEFVKYEKNVQWILKNLNDFECDEMFGKYACLESVPFLPFEHIPEKWVIGLTTRSANNYPYMDFSIRSMNSNEKSQFYINGTVSIKNSTNHKIYTTTLRKRALHWSFDQSFVHRSAYLLTVESEDLALPYKGYAQGFSMQNLFKDFYNVLVIEFSLTICVPFSVFRNE